MPEETTLKKQGVRLHIEIVTCNGWYADVQGGGGVGDWADECSLYKEDGERLLPNLFLKILTEGAVTAEAGNLCQYFTTLTEKAEPLLRR